MHRIAACLIFAGLAPAAPRLLLREGWRIQSSADVHAAPETISRAGFQTTGWYRATLPSTVLKALVENRVYPDPYFGMNLRSISGSHYPIAHNFSNIPMPPDSPFRRSWWYRTEFRIPAGFASRTIWLGFDGINFRANVWLNGRRIASAEKMAGAWRLFEFDVTAAAAAGDVNTLAVEIFPPQPHDLAITFVDWNPLPPDKDMGIWRDVHLTATGPVAVRFPQVVTRLVSPGRARLTVSAEVRNAANRAVPGVLKGRIEKFEFSQPVALGPNQTRVVTLPEITLEQPRLWWPAPVGPQNLYPLELRFETEGTVSDETSLRFGVREVTSSLDAQNHRLFRINGKNILIRGAGYTFDMLLRSSPERQEAELKYVRDMNLNAVRLEGKLEDDHFLDLCDEYGILVFAGWCCCDHWEQWQDWNQEDRVIAAESLKDQIRRLRPHASLANWMNGSDGPPPPDIERMYIGILRELNWPNPFESSATAKPTPVTGPTGVKMTGPYDYVAPSYWLLDKSRGGAHGFNTETGPGPSPPPVESLRKMLPKDHLWPIDSCWDFHSGGGPFRTIDLFTSALNARYGPAADLEDYARKAQVMAYEGHRAMFEAFGRNKYTATGVIQWMLNNAWPSMIWHLYDYYLRPGGSYFGTKKACEPLHVQYSYDDRSVVAVNSFYEAFPKMKVAARVLNLDMTEKFAKQAIVDIGADSSTRIFTIPDIAGLTATHFVALSLEDASGKRVSSNLYWLSTRPEELDWERSTWYHTPIRSYADFTALSSLPKIDLNLTCRPEAGATHVTVANPSRSLAFFVRLELTRATDGEEVLPVLWQDNYFSLLPGESREITAAYRASDLGKAAPVVAVEGWNVNRKLAR